MYISYIPGRVRIRLGDHDLMEQISKMVQNMPGILETTANPRTGSLLVHFDERLIDRDTLDSLMKNYLPKAAKAMRKSRTTAMSVVKRGMMFSLGVSLVSALLNEEGPHIATGTIFLGLLSYHLYAYRKRLFS
jgi:hypothetical protein